MNIILGIAFGSCLHHHEARPGLSNVALAKQIVNAIEFFEKENVLVVTEGPVTVALNLLGYYPDHSIVSKWSDSLDTKDFLRAALSWISCNALVKQARGRHEQMHYFLAVQKWKHFRALRCVKKITGEEADVLSTEMVPCDPDAVPCYERWVTTSVLYDALMYPFDVF